MFYILYLDLWNLNEQMNEWMTLHATEFHASTLHITLAAWLFNFAPASLSVIVWEWL